VGEVHGDRSYLSGIGMVEGSVRVAVVEDQREIREGLGFLIGRTDGFRVTGVFRSMEEALPGFEHDVPDVVLLDIGLPGMSGIDGARLLKERWPDLLILTLTVYDDDDRIFDALCAGASGYLLKKTPPARLVDSLHEVMAGGAPMSPEVAARVVKLFRAVRPLSVAGAALTPQEQRLLRLLVEGNSYKTAAARLETSINTVGFHMKSIYKKLQVHSKSEAVARALRGGLV
jgi:DNA-binding NarL/FixJ family response regulator